VRTSRHTRKGCLYYRHSRELILLTVSTPCCVQLSHRRQGNTAWKAKSAGFLGRGQSLVVEATRAIRKVGQGRGGEGGVG
jgi:hypothetical protein